MSIHAQGHEQRERIAELIGSALIVKQNELKGAQREKGMVVLLIIETGYCPEPIVRSNGFRGNDNDE